MDLRCRTCGDPDLESSHLLAAKECAQLVRRDIAARANLCSTGGDRSLVLAIELDAGVRLVHKHRELGALGELSPRDNLALQNLGADGPHEPKIAR